MLNTKKLLTQVNMQITYIYLALVSSACILYSKSTGLVLKHARLGFADLNVSNRWDLGLGWKNRVIMFFFTQVFYRFKLGVAAKLKFIFGNVSIGGFVVNKVEFINMW